MAEKPTQSRQSAGVHPLQGNGQEAQTLVVKEDAGDDNERGDADDGRVALTNSSSVIGKPSIPGSIARILYSPFLGTANCGVCPGPAGSDGSNARVRGHRLAEHTRAGVLSPLHWTRRSQRARGTRRSLRSEGKVNRFCRDAPGIDGLPMTELATVQGHAAVVGITALVVIACIFLHYESLSFLTINPEADAHPRSAANPAAHFPPSYLRTS